MKPPQTREVVSGRADVLHFLLNGRVSRVADQADSSSKLCVTLAGLSPLHVAVKASQSEALEFLLTIGAEVDTLDEQHRTPLLVSTQSSSDESADANQLIVSRLLEHGASIDVQDDIGYTALFNAVHNLHIAWKLVKAGASVHVRSFWGETLLHRAAVSGSTELFSYGIQLGLDPFAPDLFGISAIMQALEYGSQALTTFIFNSRKLWDTPPDHPNLLSEIIMSWRHKLIPLLYRSMPRGRAIEQLDRVGRRGASPLCEAARQPDLWGVRTLLDLGAAIDTEGSEQGTALMAAATHGRLEVVKHLVRSGANVQYNNTSNSKTFRSALVAARRHPQVLQWLLVGRYVDQRQLTREPPHANVEVRPWSGVEPAFEYELKRVDKRRRAEPSFEYLKRITMLKKGLLGKVVG